MIVFSLHAISKKGKRITSLARDKIAKDLNLVDENIFAFCWIVDYPMFEMDEQTKKIGLSHNLFQCHKVKLIR